MSRIMCNTKMLLIIAAAVFVCSLLSVELQAADKVVIVPLNIAKSLKNIVLVTKSDGSFSDPVAALESISDASETNPYLVLIGPGQYTLTRAMVMKPYVDVSGSGESVTLLDGSISSSASDETSAIVKAADNATLSNLSINNMGGGSRSIGIFTKDLSDTARIQKVSIAASGGGNNYGIYNYYSSPTITKVTASAGGGTLSYGVYSYDSTPEMIYVNATASEALNNFGVVNTFSSSTMTHVNAVASGGDNSYGIRNYACSPTMTNVDVEVSGELSNNYGIYNNLSSPEMTRVNVAVSNSINSFGVYNYYFSSPIMNGVNITASADNLGYGVYNLNQSSPTMTKVNTIGSGGTTGYGMYNDFANDMRIRRCTLEGDTAGLNQIGSTATISQSSIIGGVAGGGYTCVASDNGVGAALGNTCL